MRTGTGRILALFPGSPVLALVLLITGDLRIPFGEDRLGWQFGEFSSLTQGKSLSNAFVEPVIAGAMGAVLALLLHLACRHGIINTDRGAKLGVLSGLTMVVALYFAMPLLPE